MKILYRLLALAAITSATFTSATAADPGRGFVETDLVSNLATLTDKNGVVHQAAHVDLNLRNPWGVGESPTTANGPGSPFWVSENNAGKSTLYDTHGIPQPAPPLIRQRLGHTPSSPSTTPPIRARQREQCIKA